MSDSKHLLILRFSAMGDVALLAPVLRSLLSAYSDCSITLVTRPKFSVFFHGTERLKCFEADVDKTYSGFFGLIRLFLKLKRLKPSIAFDLHDNIRSRFISFLLRIAGVKIIRFNKGRKEKKELTRQENKTRNKLPHTIERYTEAFTRAGFSFSILQAPHLFPSHKASEKIEQWLSDRNLVKHEPWIGLAPFAAHKSKMWPLEKYPALIEGLIKKSNPKIFLFGGGKQEIEYFKILSQKFPDNCILVAGELRLEEELALMKKLDKALCVDSSNMHLAALLGIPTVSIWGGTHIDAGFGPFGENHKQIQIDVHELACRPCSVYGTGACHRQDFACLNRIKSENILVELTNNI